MSNEEATNRIMQFIKDDRALQLLQADVSSAVCVGCGEQVKDFNKEDNNCCNKCWLNL